MSADTAADRGPRDRARGPPNQLRCQGAQAHMRGKPLWAAAAAIAAAAVATAGCGGSADGQTSTAARTSAAPKRAADAKTCRRYDVRFEDTHAQLAGCPKFATTQQERDAGRLVREYAINLF